MTQDDSPCVAYYRVSMEMQGASSLGLNVQEAKVRDFLDGRPWQLVASFTETESGRHDDRPELAKALAYCRKNKGAKLIVATLGFLTRDPDFLLTLLDGEAEIAFADLPQVTPGAMSRFFLTQMIAVADLEAGLLSERTRAGLAAAKRKGVRIGNPNLQDAAAVGRASMKRSMDDFAKRVLPVIRDIQKGGPRSLRAIAKELTARRVSTLRGGTWNTTRVRAVLGRFTPMPEYSQSKLASVQAGQSDEMVVTKG